MVSKVSGHEILQHLRYSPDLSFTDYHFFKHLDDFVRNKTLRTNKYVESAFMNFLTFKSQNFYRRGIKDLFDRWQRCMAV